MNTRVGFWVAAERELRPKALAILVDFSWTCMLWALVVGAHFARKIMAAFGVDPEFVGYVATGEKWVFLASFAELGLVILMRMVRRVYREFTSKDGI